MSITIQLRRDTAANWTSINPVLNQGEVGVETDTAKAKLGDGETAWTSLAYWQPAGAAGSGSVTDVSVVSANGLAGTVANPTTTPAITLETTVTGLLKGNGTAISQAAAGTDYLTPSGSGASLTGITASQTGALPSTDDLSAIAAANATAGNVPMNSHKLTGLANGSASTDSAAFGQLPSSGTPLPLLQGGTGLSESTAAALLAALGAAQLAGATFTGAVACAVVALTGASTITVNAAAGDDFRLTLTSSSWTMGAPSSPVDGQVIRFQLTQDGTGSRTIAWNAIYDFGTTGAPALSTTAADTDVIGFVYNAAKTKWLCLGSALGF